MCLEKGVTVKAKGKNGYGIYIYKQSGNYWYEENGDWKEGLFDGKGCLKYNNKEEYCGNFKNGEIEGEGAFRNKNIKPVVGDLIELDEVNGIISNVIFTFFITMFERKCVKFY